MHVGTRWESAISMSCPNDLLFDNRIKACNYAHLVKCLEDRYLDYADNINYFKWVFADFIQVGILL